MNANNEVEPLTFPDRASAEHWLNTTGLPGWTHHAGNGWWACYLDDRGVWGYVDEGRMVLFPEW